MCTLYRMLQICDENGLVQKEVKDAYSKEAAREVLVICSFSAYKSICAIFSVYNPGNLPSSSSLCHYLQFNYFYNIFL